MHPFLDKNVAKNYQALPKALGKKLYVLREMIFDQAASAEGVGEIEETLKWNMPAYLTVRPKSGTTIRLAAMPDENQYGLYVHCQTTLIQTFRDMYPDSFSFEKNRGIIFKAEDAIAEEELRHCISLALTYHLK